MRKSMNGDRSMPEVEDSGGRASAVGGLPGTAELMMAMPDAADDNCAVLVKSEARIEGSAEVVKRGDFGDKMKDGVWESGANGPMDVVTLTALLRGFKEDHNFGFGEGEVKAIAFAPVLSVLHERKELAW